MRTVELAGLSDAHISLLAIYNTVDLNIPAVAQLRTLRPSCITAEQIARIFLTFLPETVHPDRYVSFVHQAASGLDTSRVGEGASVSDQFVRDISDEQARTQLSKVELSPVRHANYAANDSLDLATHFIVHRAHRLAKYGLIDFLDPLITPFVQPDGWLRCWYVSSVLPFSRDRINPTDPHRELQLADVEGWTGPEAVAAILGKPGRNAASIVHDIRRLIGPWMAGRAPGPAREAVWDPLFDWLRLLVQTHPVTGVQVLCDWGGPDDINVGEHRKTAFQSDGAQNRYYSTILQVIYTADETRSVGFDLHHRLLNRAEQLFSVPATPMSFIQPVPTVLPENPLMEDILRLDSLTDESPFIAPTAAAMSFLAAALLASRLLARFGCSLSLVETVRTRTRRVEAEQRALLARIGQHLRLSPPKTVPEWTMVRNQVVWLWKWSEDEAVPSLAIDGEAEPGNGVLGAIPLREVELEIARAAAFGEAFSFVERAYHPHFASAEWELTAAVISVLDDIFDSIDFYDDYDEKLKKMTRIIEQCPIERSISATAMTDLITASTQLAPLRLRLADGQPITPASIRALTDPLHVAELAVNQDPTAYLRVEELDSIVESLAGAGIGSSDNPLHLHSPWEPGWLSDFCRRKEDARTGVTGVAVSAALACDDFSSAYSFVMKMLITPYAVMVKKGQAVDVAWRIAVAAGRHQSPSDGMETNLVRLEQRLELLSRALVLAPPSAIVDILTQWRRCEEKWQTVAKELAKGEGGADLGGTYKSGDDGSADFISRLASSMAGRLVSLDQPDRTQPGLLAAAQNAAKAFTQSAFTTSSPHTSDRPDSQQGRVHRLVSGLGATGLRATGLGWVLGRTGSPTVPSTGAGTDSNQPNEGEGDGAVNRGRAVESHNDGVDADLPANEGD